MDKEILKLVSNDISIVKNVIRSSVNSSISDFDTSLIDYLSYPSKFLRPVLCILIQKALYKGNINNKIYLVSAAIELAHNASLLHDDVLDDAKSRRNNISYNEKFGVKPAILAGDWLLSKVLSLLNEIEEFEIYKMFSNAIQNMTEGELVQYYGKYTVPTLEEYFEKNYKKTGQLYTIASVVPLILSKEYGHIDSLKQFAKYFSNAFQIADDLSDYFVKTEDKTSCSDVEQGIYTLPEIIKINYNNKDLYEECCKILKHQVNLSLECLSFIEENEYKEAIILLCKSLLLKDKNIEV